jgi:hypothetical protein
MAEPPRQPPTGRSRRFRFWLSAVAILVVFAFMFYQSVNYVGLMYRFAEWQFARFDRYFPVLSIIGLLLILYLIWETLRYILRRGWRKLPDDTVNLRRIAARYSGARFLYFVAGIAVLLMAGTAVQWFQQPRSDGAPARIALASGASAALPAGPVEVAGVRAIGPIARYSEDFLFLRRTRYLAPIGRGGATTAAFNLFAEVRGMDPERDVPETITGILRTDAMMPEIRMLYIEANFPVAPESAIIFANPTSANRPFVVLLAELAVFALLAGLFGRHLRRTAAKQEQALRNAQTAAPLDQ